MLADPSSAPFVLDATAPVLEPELPERSEDSVILRAAESVGYKAATVDPFPSHPDDCNDPDIGRPAVAGH